VSTVTTILVLLTALALTAALGKRVPVPLPLLLIATGVGISFVPGFEPIGVRNNCLLGFTIAATTSKSASGAKARAAWLGTRRAR